jgi:YbgC/YbaW family acyl-CoA thioester hydrolase
MNRADFRHFERLRVRWAEVDMQRIVFNGHYLAFVDTAVGGYWRSLGLPYQETMAQMGGDLYVRKATLEYFGSAVYDDLLDVGVRHHRTGNTSLTLSTGVFRGEQLLVSAEMVYVFADPATQRPLPVPECLREAFAAFEAGAAMVEVVLGGWPALGPRARALRNAVFVLEQGLPAELEADPADDGALHALAVNRLGMPLATGRLLESGGRACIGRMAVRQTLRGGRVGRAVLDALLSAARARGHAEVQVHALRTAERFYLQAGFEAQGAPFVEAGLAHVQLRRRLG